MKFLEENLLDYLRHEEFAGLYASLVKRSYRKDSFICRPGEGDDSVFIVAGGRARIYLGYEDKEFNLGILSKGDIYSTHTRAYVQALENTEVLVTDVRTFRQKMLDYPEVTKAMVGVLGGMLKATFTIIENLAFKDVSGRLVALLSSEARRHGIPSEAGGVTVRIDLSIEQIARLVGSTRQTVSTLLGGLSREGLIKKLGRGSYLVYDPDLLENYGDGRNDL